MWAKLQCTAVSDVLLICSVHFSNCILQDKPCKPVPHYCEKMENYKRYYDLKDDEEVDVAGDGHYDSPSWCAKYCTYIIRSKLSMI